MEDLREYLDRLGGADRLWEVTNESMGEWLPVSACCLSRVVEGTKDRRVLIYTDYGVGRGHELRLSSFVAGKNECSGIETRKDGKRGVKWRLRGLKHKDLDADKYSFRWLLNNRVTQAEQLRACQQEIAPAYRASVFYFNEYEADGD